MIILTRRQIWFRSHEYVIVIRKIDFTQAWMLPSNVPKALDQI